MIFIVRKASTSFRALSPSGGPCMSQNLRGHSIAFIPESRISASKNRSLRRCKDLGLRASIMSFFSALRTATLFFPYSCIFLPQGFSRKRFLTRSAIFLYIGLSSAYLSVSHSATHSVYRPLLYRPVSVPTSCIGITVEGVC